LRLKLVNEILSGIRIVKFYAWEKPFIGKVGEIRAEELKHMMTAGYAWTYVGFLIASIPVTLPIVVFYSYVSFGRSLDYVTAFTTLLLLNQLTGPIIAFPACLNGVVYAAASTARITRFLSLPVPEPYVTSAATSASAGEFKAEDVVAAYTDASLGWTREEDAAAALSEVNSAVAKEVSAAPPSSSPSPSPSSSSSSTSTTKAEATAKRTEQGAEYEQVKSSEDEEANTPTPANINTNTNTAVLAEAINDRSINTLVDLNVRVRRGELVCVVGAVGAGKSSFLSGLLGEMSLLRGEVFVQDAGLVALHQQQPWVINDTIEQNILFGSPYDAARLKEVIKASALKADILAQPAGIKTEIGEKGITLSGGQKAR